MELTLAFDRSECPSCELLDLFVNEQLVDEQDTLIQTHVDDCPACQAYLDSKARGEPHLLHISPLKSRESTDSIYKTPEIPGYEVLSFCKSGGQGIVFKARDTSLNRMVAIKIVNNDQLRESNTENSILIEAQAIARLSHPNIVKLHNLAWTQQGPALIMDWVEGSSLLEWLGERNCTHKQAAVLLQKLCDAVAFSHEKGILHRDIKPSNILLNDKDLNQPMICDFGLAKLIRSDGDYSTVTIGMGTAGYMPPEMIMSRFGKIHTTADIYSLGALLYRLLTGHLPHESNSLYETMELTCEKDVTPPSFFDPGIHRDLETICLKCLQRDPSQRYSSASQLKIDLEKYLSEQPVLARRATELQKLKQWQKANPWLAALAMSLFGVMLLSMILLSYALNRAVRGERRTEAELARTANILKLSAPLVKSYLQLGILKPDELKKVQRLAEDFKEIGTNSTSLRQRFDLIYVGLQLASGLREIKGQDQLAIEMTRQGRADMKLLIDQNRHPLDHEAFLMDKGKIAISLLDQSLVRYGHSCIQLYEMIRSFNGTSGLIESEPYLNEAIAAAEEVMHKNPEMTEPSTDLANYYLYKQDLLNLRNDMKSAAELAIKTELLHAAMLKMHPDAPEKIGFWLGSVQALLRTDPELIAGKVNMQDLLKKVREEMARVESNPNDTTWRLTAESFSYVILMDSRIDFGEQRIGSAQQKLLDLMPACRALAATNPPLPIHLKTYLMVGVETIAALWADESRHKEAQKLFEELERFFKRGPNDDLHRQLLAELYFRSPIEQSHSAEKAAGLLHELTTPDDRAQFLSSLCRVHENPAVTAPSNFDSLLPEFQTKWFVTKIGNLANLTQQNESMIRSIEAELSRRLASTITIDDQLRLSTIKKRMERSID